MPQIQCLPPHVADLIAAGEVVERPASVIKELLENAIDAGACAIVAEVEHGGLTYIRITDNGCGIAPEQLPTAFLRHATSKLRAASDLAAIGTLGFRGEALAAIAAVSRVDIFSRTAEEEMGAALHLEGGVPGHTEPTGCPLGTTICVRDLFYNTPARMKFMKKDSAEGAAVSGVVQHLALSHPAVSFRLLRDGQEVLHTPGDGQLHSAVYAAMGRDFALGLLPLSGSGGDVRVDGFVTKPLNGHGSRGKQVFFVNGRFVKSQLLTAALEEAYKNRLLKGRFPGCVLHVTLPAAMVDVNVHPAKTVVKFVSDKSVFDAVYYTVKDALDGEKNSGAASAAPQHMHPSAANAQYAGITAPKPGVFAPKSGVNAPFDGVNVPQKPAADPEFFQKMSAEEFRIRASASAEEKKPLGSFSARGAAPATKNVILDHYPQETTPAAEPEQRPHSAAPILVRDVAPGGGTVVSASPLTGRTYAITPPEDRSGREDGETPQTKPYQGLQENRDSMDAPAQAQISLPGEPQQQTLEPVKEAPWRMVGEVLKTYIICEDDHDTVWLIDKHAAHERLRFDALKAGHRHLMAQPLLAPVTVELEPESYAAVLENLLILQEFGFFCEDFGGGTVLIREVPADILAADAAATLEELAQKLALGRADPAAARDELLHTMACKSAIKAGMTTDAAELAALVEKVQSGEILYCPHGRPVKYKLSKYDIEKMFKRA